MKAGDKMALRIKCPYCFEEFNDDEVHFRVPTVKEPDASVLPEGIASVEELQLSKRFSDEEKDKIAKEYWQANFYGPQRDEKYMRFWAQYDGTTEKSPRDSKYPNYWKRIIEPTRDIGLLRQLVPGDTKSLNNYLRRDKVSSASDESLVVEITVNDGTVCNERVCPYCHNPLPHLYGAFPIKFISIVGNTGSGKTVYLSQLIRNIVDNLAEVGYTADLPTPSVISYLSDNEILIGKELPFGTPANSLQQPIVFEIAHEQNRQTIVIYDVAGELFADNQRYTLAEIHKSAECIMHSDALLMLIDPMQFSALGEVLSLENNRLTTPNTVIASLHNLLLTRSRIIPVAVCISKGDEIYTIMPDGLANSLQADYKGIPSEDSVYRMKPVFNTEDFNSYESDLMDFVYHINSALCPTLAAGFEDFAFFAVSALGCPVDVIVTESGDHIATPRGPIEPKRIMDPFYWIMYKFGLLEASGGVFNPNGKRCPRCQDQTTIKLKEPYELKTGFLRKKIRRYKYYCSSCKCYFDPDTGDCYSEL